MRIHTWKSSSDASKSTWLSVLFNANNGKFKFHFRVYFILIGLLRILWIHHEFSSSNGRLRFVSKGQNVHSQRNAFECRIIAIMLSSAIATDTKEEENEYLHWIYKQIIIKIRVIRMALCTCAISVRLTFAAQLTVNVKQHSYRYNRRLEIGISFILNVKPFPDAAKEKCCPRDPMQMPSTTLPARHMHFAFPRVRLISCNMHGSKGESRGKCIRTNCPG